MNKNQEGKKSACLIFRLRKDVLNLSQRFRVSDDIVQARQPRTTENERIARKLFPFRGCIQARENIA